MKTVLFASFLDAPAYNLARCELAVSQILHSVDAAWANVVHAADRRLPTTQQVWLAERYAHYCARLAYWTHQRRLARETELSGLLLARKRMEHGK